MIIRYNLLLNSGTPFNYRIPMRWPLEAHYFIEFSIPWLVVSFVKEKKSHPFIDLGHSFLSTSLSFGIIIMHE